MNDYKTGNIIIHKLTKQKLLVICTSTDGLVTCRYQDSNGVYQSLNFYREEVEEIKNEDTNCGFISDPCKIKEAKFPEIKPEAL